MDCRIIKNEKMKNRKIIYSLAFVLVSGMLQAQEPFTDDVQDVPVNDYLPVLFIIAIATAYWVLKPKAKA
jgi:hypothetical protein